MYYLGNLIIQRGLLVPAGAMLMILPTVWKLDSKDLVFVLATLTVAKQNLLFECLQEFDLLRKSTLHVPAFSFEKAAQPVGFALS